MKTIKIETIYSCVLLSKSLRQEIEYMPDVPYGFGLSFKNGAVDLNDIKLLHKFLGEIIEDQENLHN